MKKILSLLLAISIIVCAIPFGAFTFSASAESYTDGYYTYTVNQYNQATITGVDTTISGDVTVPAELGGYPVNYIGGEAFYNCKNLTSIMFSNYLYSIDYRAFERCYNLTKIDIPNSVTYIGHNAFAYCQSLESITIPEGVTSLSDRTFASCDSLTNINFNAKSCYLSVSNYPVFQNTNNLKTIHIGDKVEKIPIDFSQFENLEGVYITNLTSWCNINYYSYSNRNPLTFAKNLYLNGELITDLIIPSNVTNIKDFVFSNCSSFKSITIPKSVNVISQLAFRNCENIESINVSENNATFYCKGNCIIKRDNEALILGCKNSEIPNGVQSITTNAFRGCTGLKKINIPQSVLKIDGSAFSGCTSLTEFNVAVENAAYCSVGGVLFNKDITTLIKYPDNRNGSSYVIPNNVTTIDDSAFYGNPKLTSITIPNTVSTIGSYAFYGCNNLRKVYYRGTVSEKQSMSISGLNYAENSLRNAEWYYNSCLNSSTHTYSNSCDSICNWCGDTRIAPHNYIWITDEYNNCGVNGFQHEECSACHITRNENTVIEATGKHIYYNSCDTSCDVCGFTRDITHKYDNACDEICNICDYIRSVGDHTFTINDGFTCEVCKYSKAPNIPTIESITNDTVTLTPYSYLEYSNDGIDWQSTNVFTGLQPETKYTFYQRVKGSNNALQSESSEGISVFTKKAYYIKYDANGGIGAPYMQTKTEGIPINISSQTPTRDGYKFAGWGSTQKCGKQYSPGEGYMADSDITLYALWYDFDECDNCYGIGTVNQSCSRCGGSGNVYTRKCSNCGSTNITHHITGYGSYYSCNSCSSLSTTTTSSKCNRCNGTGIRYNTTCTTCLGEGGEVIKLVAPTILSFTDTTVTLLAQEGYEYSNDGIIWQDSNVFSNLLPGTKYVFYVRKAPTDTTPFSAASEGEPITTDKAKQTAVPDAPTVQSFTADSITLNLVEGCEYSKNGTHWQTSNVFSGLDCGTEYTFYQRYKETSSTYTGKSSVALLAKTDKGTQSKPSVPTLFSRTHNSITLTAHVGYEYSLDAMNWQTSNVFTGLNPQTNYSFYQRKAETERYYASDASSRTFISTTETPNCVYDPTLHIYDDKYDADCNVCGTIRKATPREWSISVTASGVYNIKPSQTISGFSKNSITVFDKDGSVVKYNDSKNGWPLVAGQEYTIKFNKEFDYSGELTWKTTKKADNIFPDTDKDGWYNDAVTYAVGAGIMSGYQNGKFGTSDSIQRQDFLVMLARYEGVDLSKYNYKSKFSDVARGSYYEAAVNWGAENGIVTGYNNGKFGVGDKVTREQLVTFLYRYAKYKGIDTTCTTAEKNYVKNTYSDYKNVSSFAQDAIVWAVTYGVIGGKTPTTIVPQGNAQRCEVAKIMYNIYLNDIFK